MGTEGTRHSPIAIPSLGDAHDSSGLEGTKRLDQSIKISITTSQGRGVIGHAKVVKIGRKRSGPTLVKNGPIARRMTGLPEKQ